MNFFIDKSETTHRVHVFKIYMRYELFNYVLKVYVAYVNSTVIPKFIMFVAYIHFM